jgi:regulator of sigma E protease
VLGEVKAGGPAAAAGLRRATACCASTARRRRRLQTLRERIRSPCATARPCGRSSAGASSVPGRLLELTVTPRRRREGGRSSAASTPSSGQPPEMVTVRTGPVDGLVQGAAHLGGVGADRAMLGRMLIGEASLKNLSGPLTIADYAGQSVKQGLAYYLGFLALVSVSLGC